MLKIMSDDEIKRRINELADFVVNGEENINLRKRTVPNYRLDALYGPIVIRPEVAVTIDTTIGEIYDGECVEIKEDSNLFIGNNK